MNKITKKKIIHLIHTYYSMGFLPSTSGNFSFRKNKNTIYISGSGIHKGKIKKSHFLLLDLISKKDVITQQKLKPSAETDLHCMIYDFFPEKSNVVLHTHSVLSTFLSKYLLNEGTIKFENYEILKVFPEITTHETKIEFPIFKNSQNMNEIIEAFKLYSNNKKNIYAFFIAGHGLYTWGEDIDTAAKYLEAIEFLLNIKWNELLLENRIIQ